MLCFFETNYYIFSVLLSLYFDLVYMCVTHLLHSSRKISIPREQKFSIKVRIYPKIGIKIVIFTFFRPTLIIIWNCAIFFWKPIPIYLVTNSYIFSILLIIAGRYHSSIVFVRQGNSTEIRTQINKNHHITPQVERIVGFDFFNQ